VGTPRRTGWRQKKMRMETSAGTRRIIRHYRE
jgi:hypothetical protein